MLVWTGLIKGPGDRETASVAASQRCDVCCLVVAGHLYLRCSAVQRRRLPAAYTSQSVAFGSRELDVIAALRISLDNSAS